MWDSFKLFLKELSRNIYFWLSFVCVIYSVYDLFIKKYLPAEYQKEINVPIEYVLLLIIVLMIIAGAKAFHKLRMARLQELWKIDPEAKKWKAHMTLYRLYNQGLLEKRANTERRQRWDTELLKNMEIYCNNSFKNIYLLNTGRRHGTITALEDKYFDDALRHLKDILDDDSYYWLKTN